MNGLISDLNKAFDSRIRLGIMSLLMVNDFVEFNTVKEILKISDGNIASHISALEKTGYVSVKKEFRGKKPVTSYSATVAGRKAFEKHLTALEQLIQSGR